MLNPLEYAAPALMDLMPARMQDKLHALAVKVTYEPDQIIHSRGDNKPGVSIVRKGAARVGTIGADGSFHTISVLGPGQCLGEQTLFANLPRTHDVSAVGKTEIDQIPGSAFLNLFDQEPELARALLINSLTRSHVLLERLDDMRRLSLPVRTAKYLLSLSMSSVDPAKLVCTQTELADALGVSRVSLGKALGKLERRGLIRSGYGEIDLPDPNSLSRWIDSHRQTEALMAH